MRKLEKVGVLVCIERMKVQSIEIRILVHLYLIFFLLSVSDVQTYSTFSLNFTQNFEERKLKTSLK